jgi:hypothetical protein
MRYYQDERGRVGEFDSPPTWGNYTPVSAKAGKAAMQRQAIDALAEMLPAGATVYTMIRHVAASGMSRAVSVVIRDGERVRCVDNLIARALGYSLSKRGGVTVRGCGFDAGFEIVYNLGAAIWPNGTPEPHGVRNGQPDNAGGYALKHERLS